MRTLTKTTVLLVAALTLGASAQASAQRFRGAIVVGPRVHLYAPFYYDPFWWPYGAYYPYTGRGAAEVKVEVSPKQTQVFVDGYYAGVSDDFDGLFKRLRTTPGGHTITLYLDGYRTVNQNIYVRPDSTFKIRDTMDKLAGGETSAPVPPPMPRPPVPEPTSTR